MKKIIGILRGAICMTVAGVYVGVVADDGGCPVAQNIRGHENVEWSISYAFHLTDANKELPRVLLVGDSICNGYQERVRKLTEGKCNVSYWISSYCVTSPEYMRLLAFHLEAAQYDVVHFNNGLHSLQTDTQAWAKAFESALKLVREKQTRARIVWATSTPLKEADKTAKARELNDAARLVVERLGGIETDDLFALIDPLDRETYWSDVYHHRAEAVELEAKQVTRTICPEVQKKLMSFNVCHCQGMDGRVDVARTAERIVAEAPDFACLQELDRCTMRSNGIDQPAELGRMTGMHATFSKAIPYQGGEYGVLILSREKPTHVIRTPLPGSEPRVLLLCEFADCVVGTMHLSVAAASERMESIALIRNALASFVGKKPVFLTGDWNSLPDSDVLRGLGGILKVVSDTRCQTYHGRHENGPDGQPRDMSRFCIDYIACDKEHESMFEIVNTHVVDDRKTSDHAPIVVTLELSDVKDNMPTVSLPPNTHDLKTPLYLVETGLDLAHSELLYSFDEFRADEWTIFKHESQFKWEFRGRTLAGGGFAEEKHGQVFYKTPVVGDVVLEFDARTIAPSYHDIVWLWGARFDTEPWSVGFLGCLGGWWDDLAGIESLNASYTPSVIHQADKLVPGRWYHVVSGTVRGINFISVDGKLITRYSVPSSKSEEGYFGFGFYQSFCEYANLKVWRPALIPVSRHYEAAQTKDNGDARGH